MVYRVVMRDRCGRVTAMSGEITGPNEDCQRLAKRTFLDLPEASRTIAAMSWPEIAKSRSIRVGT